MQSYYMLSVLLCHGEQNEDECQQWRSDLPL